MFITLLVFLVIIGLLVFVHELGHFLVARRNGVRVLEFAFGFRPRLWAKKVGETTYAINSIPLGGYVRLFGEEENQLGPDSFRSKTIGQRFQILVAGAVMNLLLGWLILTILFIAGFQPLFPGVANNPFVKNIPPIVITTISTNSPAKLSGLKVGDLLTAINDQKVATREEFVAMLGGLKGQPVRLTIKRANETLRLEATPRINPPAGEGALGVGLETGGKVKTSIMAAPAAGIYETGRIIGLSAKGFGDFIGGLIFKQKVSEDVTGLIGVGALTGVARRLGLQYLAQLVVMITIGLGVINLMPILPLDGGHIAALVYEKVVGRPLSERQLGGLVTAGLGLVLALFLIVTYKDVLRFGIFSRFF